MPSRPGAPGGGGASVAPPPSPSAVPVRYGTKAIDTDETLGIPVFVAADFDSGPHYHRGLFDHASNHAPAFAWPSATSGAFVLLGNGSRRTETRWRESTVDVVIDGVPHQWIAIQPSARAFAGLLYEWYFVS